MSQSTESAKKRGLDAELQTMARIDRQLADLTPAQVARVLAWICGKHEAAKTLGGVGTTTFGI